MTAMKHEEELTVSVKATKMETVWIQNLKGFINGVFPADDRWKKIFIDQLERIDQAPNPHEKDLEDAERFRALLRCGRIKMQGSSGVDPKTGKRNGNNVHFGAEFWPEPIPAGYEEHYEASTRWGRACIKALADAILEEEARAALTAKQTDGREGNG